MTKQKIGILSLGCPRNLVDSETITGRLNLKGYRIVDIDKADIAIVNTCSFIEEAKKESIDAIIDLISLKKKGELEKIIVYGCLAQRYKDLLRKELPEVDAFVGGLSLNHSNARFPITPKHFAYLKICEGCLNNCSFCVIPKIKGKFSSLSVDSVLSRIDEFNRQKVSEVNIIGQDITGYGMDLGKDVNLAGILREIEKRAGNIGWLRLLYLNPARVDEELLRIIRDSPKICKYIDLPVQHINNRILKLMNRKTEKKDILRTIEKIRKYMPQAAIRTSVITGFPSETDAEFKELLSFIKEAKFERLGAFIYSREEGTRAFSFKPQVPQKIKTERFEQIMSEQQNIARDCNKKFMRKTIEVLIDGPESGSYLGRSQFDAPEVDGLVYVKSSRRLRAGDFVKVKITDTLEYDLSAEAL